MATMSRAAIVDEPLGARYSLGLTLWHLGHNAGYIEGFHAFLQAHGIDPLKLDPPAASPKASNRLLLEPELLPAANLNTNGGGWPWTVNDTFVHGSVHDPGAGTPIMSMPLTITAAGRYRLWIRYYGWKSGYGPTSLKIYRNGTEADGPVLYDEIYDVATPTEGWCWKDLLVDLTPGAYTLYFAHLGHGWRNMNGGANGYCERNIDCLYLTDELWASAPSDAQRQEMRNADKPTGIQWTASHTLTAAEAAKWKLWQVRPVSWEEKDAKPALFAQSQAYWRSLVSALTFPDYQTKVPDFRADNRQVIFHETWNMLANPVRIARQIAALRSDVLPPDSPKLNEKYYWMTGNQLDHQDGSGWWVDGGSLVAAWGTFDGVAWHDYPIDNAGNYYVWVHYGYNWVFGPWYMTATNQQRQSIRFEMYTTHKGSGNMWERFPSPITMTAASKLRIAVGVPKDQKGLTYRWIRDVLITTDPNYVPQESVRPPISAAQYLTRAKQLGANIKYPYFYWLPDFAYEPVLQDAWPSAPVQPGDTSKSLSMVRDTHRAVHLPLRSLSAKPVSLDVTCGPLHGPGGAFPDKVTWRVVSYSPAGGEFDRQSWTPFVLLRRPDITVPPWSVAALWFDIDSTGVTPGDYACDVTLRAPSVPNRVITFKVHISGIDASAAAPILLGGWSTPPEGEVYTRDYTAHGMNIWFGEMPKAEMVARGIKLLSIGMWGADQKYIRGVVDRLLGLGLGYDDFVFSVMDEPNGATEKDLQGYIDIAKAIHAVDPKVRVSFNPGEAASLATFQILDPYCQMWLPFGLHLNDPAKMAIITAKPWMWYTTPDLWDKTPGNPWGMYGQVRTVPAQAKNCIGTQFFAFNYVWRDYWDIGYEVVGDEGETVLPSRYGPVTTRVWEAIREGMQDARLANMVKAQAGPSPSEDERTLMSSGTPELLIQWLEGMLPVTVLADSVREFSTTDGKDNWHYGYYDGPVSATARQWQAGPFKTGTKAGMSLWDNGGCPIKSNWVVRRWVAKTTGTITITGKLAKAEAGGDGLIGHILVNGNEVWSQVIAAEDTTGMPYVLNADVTAGDAIDFAIDARGNDDKNDKTTFTAVISTGQVATPTFSIVPGTYGSTQAVTINCRTRDASMRYTTDGSTPSLVHGTLYHGPVTVGTTNTLKAVAYRSGMSNSAVTSGLYTITGALADSEVEFSSNQGKENWYYGYYDKPASAQFVQGTWDGARHAWRGAEDTCVMTSTDVSPGRTDWVVRRWVAKRDYPVQLIGMLAKTDTGGGDGVTGHILLNGKEVWSRALAFNNAAGITFALNMALKAGDVIDLALDPNGQSDHDGTKFIARVMPGVLADCARDYSAVQGQRNWYYGYFDKPASATFVPATFDANTKFWSGPEAYCLVMADGNMHPGSTDWSVRRWVAPADMPVYVTGRLAKTDKSGGNGVIGHILWNGKEVWSQAIAFNNSTGETYGLDLDLKAGDTVDFALDPNGQNSNDSSLFSAVFYYR